MALVENVFGLLARARGGRAVHAEGVLFDARLDVDPGSLLGDALGGPRSRPVEVRLSRSLGLPDAVPDLPGAALRIPYARDGVLDVLLASTGRRGLAHLVLRPARSWWRRDFGTLLPYRVRGRLALLGLRTGADDTEPIAVTETPLPGARRTVGSLHSLVERPDPPRLAFDPVLNALPGLRPARPLTRIRERAYTGSRRGRRVPPPVDPG